MVERIITGKDRPDPSQWGPLKIGDLVELPGEYPFSTVVYVQEFRIVAGVTMIDRATIKYINQSVLDREEWTRRFFGSKVRHAPPSGGS